MERSAQYGERSVWSRRDYAQRREGKPPANRVPLAVSEKPARYALGARLSRCLLHGPRWWNHYLARSANRQGIKARPQPERARGVLRLARCRGWKSLRGKCRG